MFLLSLLSKCYKNSLYMNAFYLMANTLVSSLLGFFFWVIAARFYTPDEVGNGAALISAATLLAVFSNLGFNFGIVRFLPNSKDQVSLVNTCLSTVIAASFIFSILFLLLVPFLSPALTFVLDVKLFAFSFVLIVVVWTVFPLVDHVFIAKRKSNLVVMKSIIFNSVKIPLAVLVASYGAYGIFASWGIAMALAIAVALLVFFPRILEGFSPSVKISRRIISDILRFSFGNHFANLLYISPSLILPLIVVNLFGGQMNAYFYVAFMLAELLFIIPTAVSQSLFSEGSTNKEKAGEYIQSSLLLAYSLLIPAIVIMIIIADKLLMLFGAEYSENGVGLLRIFSLSGFFLGANMIYFTILRIEKKIWETIIISAVLAVGILGLGFLLLTILSSIVAVGYSWLIVHALVSVYTSNKIWSGLKFKR